LVLIGFRAHRALSSVIAAYRNIAGVRADGGWPRMRSDRLQRTFGREDWCAFHGAIPVAFDGPFRKRREHRLPATIKKKQAIHIWLTGHSATRIVTFKTVADLEFHWPGITSASEDRIEASLGRTACSSSASSGRRGPTLTLHNSRALRFWIAGHAGK
jgi:hypothetical protein